MGVLTRSVHTRSVHIYVRAKNSTAKINKHTVKICDSALGLSGFVSFFWWAYLRGGLSKENL